MRIQLLAAAAALALPAGLAIAQTPGSEPSTQPAPPPAGAQGGADQSAGLRAEPATPADLAAGATVSDPSGQPVGTVESVTETGVVLAVGEKRIQVPSNSIGKNERGLMIPISRAELEAAAVKAAGG